MATITATTTATIEVTIELADNQLRKYLTKVDDEGFNFDIQENGELLSGSTLSINSIDWGIEINGIEKENGTTYSNPI